MFPMTMIIVPFDKWKKSGIRRDSKAQFPAHPHHVVDIDQEEQGSQNWALWDSTLNLTPAWLMNPVHYILGPFPHTPQFYDP